MVGFEDNYLSSQEAINGMTLQRRYALYFRDGDSKSIVFDAWEGVPVKFFFH